MYNGAQQAYDTYMNANENSAPALAARALDLIEADAKIGMFPLSEISCFADLHDFVDANEYLSEAHDLGGDELVNGVVRLVDAAVKAGVLGS